MSSPEDEVHNSAVEELLREQIMPEIRKRMFLRQESASSTFFKLCGSLGVWKDISKSIFYNLEVKARRFYALKRREIDSRRGEIPYGFAMKWIDARFMEEPSFTNSNVVIDEINSSWGSIDDYLKKGFGFVLVRGGEEVVCWCTAEYVSKNKCGIGIETLQKYQRRGFATLTALAFVEHCISNDITPYWDSWDDNIGSNRVAEKVGFDLVEKYEIFFGSLC